LAPPEEVKREEGVSAAMGLVNKTRDGIETMMEVHVVGLSHHKAPVEVREKLAVAEKDWNRYAQELVHFTQTDHGYLVPEVAVLSTCNRFEVYFATPEIKKFLSVETVKTFLRTKSGLTEEELNPYLFQHSGEAAAQHLFEVSSGLDSLVLGEAQILGQVRACHNHSIQKECDGDGSIIAGSGGKIIARMLNDGIHIGKQVRTHTKIGKGSVSVSSAAVELMMSRSIHDLHKKAEKLKVCIVGAGRMTRLLLLALFSKYPDIKVTVVNRSTENAEALLKDDMVARRGGSNASVASMDDMWEVIEDSDVVLTATASKDTIINPEDLQNLKHNLMLIDISLPRNVHADCGEVEGVASYSVDDLKKVGQANSEKRQLEVIPARRLIEKEVRKFRVWQTSQGAAPYFLAMQTWADEIRKDEKEKATRKLQNLTTKQWESVDKMTKHILDQVFRPIFSCMKTVEESDVKRSKIWALKEMFGLRPEYKRRLRPRSAPVPLQLPAVPVRPEEREPFSTSGREDTFVPVPQLAEQ